MKTNYILILAMVLNVIIFTLSLFLIVLAPPLYIKLIFVVVAIISSWLIFSDVDKLKKAREKRK